MRYLTKEIHQSFLIDFFTPQERLQPIYKATQQLESFLQANGIPVASYIPNSRAELLNALEDINTRDIGEGLIIHFIGHGDATADIFGNANYTVEWTVIRPLLVAIINRSNDGLIMNTTIMCHGKDIFQLVEGTEKPFFAAVGSLSSTSLQANEHNKQLYEKCFNKDRAESSLRIINGDLKFSQGKEKYELQYA